MTEFYAREYIFLPPNTHYLNLRNQNHFDNFDAQIDTNITPRSVNL